MPKLLRQNVGGTDYTMVGCALTGVCASAADAFIKAVTLSDGDEISDGMTVIVTFANGNTAGTAPASKTIYSSDQVNYYEDTGLTVPFILAPAGCYEITYTGEGNAYTYISYPVIQIGNITGVICDASGNTVSGSLWTKGAQVGIMFKDGKFLLISGALLNNMSALPTDAVLHYSFDEVPDYPDGTADVRRVNGDTYGVGAAEKVASVGTVTTDAFAQDGQIHKSNVNGNVNYKTDTSSSLDKGIYFALNSYQGKVVIIDFFAKTTNLNIRIHYRQSATDSRTIIYPLGTSVALGKHRIMLSVPANCAEYSLTFYSNNTVPNYTEWELQGYYVGDGSYVTPIIDNANGQNNGTNNGGLAVKGVSGKGAYFLNGRYANLGNFNLTPNFSVCMWVKPDNDTDGLLGRLFNEVGVFAIRNGTSDNNSLNIILFDTNNVAIVNARIRDLLPANVWTHLVVVRNNLSFLVYENGKVIFSRELTSSSIKTTTDYTYIGQNDNTRNEAIDDLLIFNRALSETEVVALYLNKANTPKYYSWADWKLQQMA